MNSTSPPTGAYGPAGSGAASRVYSRVLSGQDSAIPSRAAAEMAKVGGKIWERSPVMVIVLTMITFGIYAIVWQVKTKNEMNSLGAQIPTAWLLIVPIANLWWMWKYCEGVQQVTRGKQSQVIAFILLWLLSVIGMAILQSSFNEVAAGSQLPNARAMGNPGESALVRLGTGKLAVIAGAPATGKIASIDTATGEITIARAPTCN